MLTFTKALLLICAFVSGLTAPTIARAESSLSGGDQQDIPTNFGLLKMTLEEAIEEVCDRLPSYEPKVLCLKPQTASPGNWLVEKALLDILLRRGYRIITADSLISASQKVCDQAHQLRYRIVTLDLNYDSSRRQHLFGPRLVERNVHLYLLLQLSQAAGEVLWVEEIEKTKGDWILAKALPSVEKESLSFISPTLRVDGWGRFAEPALLTTVIGAFIYIFYSTQ